MSKHFYFIDPNGRFESEDRTVRYSLLKGKVAIEKLKERRIRFMRYKDEEDEILIEIKADRQSDYRKHERHEQYIRDLKDEYQPIILSLDNTIEIDGEEVVYHDVIASDYDLEEEIIKREELSMLKKSLSALNKEEMDLIYNLYLIDDPLSLREYASQVGLHFTTVDYRVKKILEKLKLFFEKSPTK